MATLCTLTTACSDPKTCDDPGHATYQASLATPRVKATKTTGGKSRKLRAARPVCAKCPEHKPFRSQKTLGEHNAWKHPKVSAKTVVPVSDRPSPETLYEFWQSGQTQG